MLRSGILVIALLFLSVSFAATNNNNDLAKKFSEAQQLATQGEITQAIAVYQALIKSHPLLPEAYNNLAVLYLKQKNTKEAKHILEQGLYAHKGYGVLYESLTAINVAMAREAYSKALQIDVKPTEINIASLSLDKNTISQNKNTIVISKIKKPVKNTVTDTKPAETKPAEVNVVTATKSSGTITRDNTKNNSIVSGVNQSANPQEIEIVLKAWSAAWSAQAVDMYLSFYHKQYRPNNGMSKKSWKQSRRYRLKKPSWIKVSLSDFKVEKNTGKQAVVNFKQLYRSNTFRDVSDKQMVLFYTDDGWKIFREKSI